MDRVQQMYQAIKQKILDLEVDPTQPIDEKAMVRSTGGSLTLVQQALGMLEDEGMVTKRRRRWYVTRAATASTMSEIFEVRTTLEGMCARLAAARITPEEIERMEQLLRDFPRPEAGLFYRLDFRKNLIGCPVAAEFRVEHVFDQA